MVAVMLAGVMFPLWPGRLKVGVWYLSVGALGLVGAFIVLAIVRLIFWCFTKIFMAKAIWMFPNLFEDVGFVSIQGGRPDARLTRSFPCGHGTSPRRRGCARSGRSARQRSTTRRPRPLLRPLRMPSQQRLERRTPPALLQRQLPPPRLRLLLPTLVSMPTLPSLPRCATGGQRPSRMLGKSSRRHRVPPTA